MGVKLHVKDKTIVAYLNGELDHHAAREIRKNIDDACLRTSPELIVLDFGEVTFMDSSGIGLVMGRYKLMQDLGGKVLLASLSPYIEKMMKLAGLDQIVTIDNGGRQNESN